MPTLETETQNGEFEDCPHCAMPNSKKNEFCEFCGKKLDTDRERPESDHKFPDHEM